jgi:Holliday junction resolvase RusA-like endonuclease
MFQYKKTRWPLGTIHFTIYGTPIGKGMPRVVKMKSGITRAFKPEATDRWETSIAGQAFKYKPPVPFDEALALGVLFYRPMPKYIMNSKQKKEAALKFELLPDKKPDLKNLIASVEDALEGVFYINDSSIVTYIPIDGLPTGKYYSITPRVEIVLAPIRVL